MTNLIFKRILQAVLLLVFLSFVIFFAVYFMPGNITDAMFSHPEAISNSVKSAILEKYGLNDNPFLQYFRWVKEIIYGNFGFSFITGESIISLISERIINTTILTILSICLIIILSLILGFFCAIKKDNFLDIFVNFSSFILVCLPHFLVGLILIVIFSIKFQLLPSSGSNRIGELGLNLKYTILPMLSIVLPHLGIYIKFVRDTLIENLNLDFVQTAYARGLSKTKARFLAFKNALPAIISYFGTLVGGIFASSYVIEAIFSFPGIGELAINSIISKDYPVVLAVVLLTSVFVIIGNLLAQILVILIDKRNL